MSEEQKVSKEQYEKERAAAVTEIANLLNKYKLTIIAEHTITIIPKEQLR